MLCVLFDAYCDLWQGAIYSHSLILRTCGANPGCCGCPCRSFQSARKTALPLLEESPALGSAALRLLQCVVPALDTRFVHARELAALFVRLALLRSQAVFSNLHHSKSPAILEQIETFPLSRAGSRRTYAAGL